MFNQHAKWLDDLQPACRGARKIASLNLLITSTVWRQDHNGFTHQDPGFLDVVVNKSPDVVPHLPAAGRELPALASPTTACGATNYINVIVSDKQKHLQYLNMDDGDRALHQGHRHLGLGEQRPGRRAGRRDGLRRRHPDAGGAGRGRAAARGVPGPQDPVRQRGRPVQARSRTPSIRTDCPTATSTACSPTDKPIIFNFHGYPWLIHRLTYRRTNHDNLHVRGYKEKGNINTPLELAIQNQIDRFSLAMDVIDRVPRLQVAGAHAKEKFRNLQIDCQQLRLRARRRQARRGELEVAVLTDRRPRPRRSDRHERRPDGDGSLVPLSDERAALRHRS